MVLAMVVQWPFAALLASVLDAPLLASFTLIAVFGLVVSYPYAHRGVVAAVGSSLVLAGVYAVVAYAAGRFVLPWG
jgi:hypothetical protein